MRSGPTRRVAVLPQARGGGGALRRQAGGPLLRGIARRPRRRGCRPVGRGPVRRLLVHPGGGGRQGRRRTLQRTCPQQDRGNHGQTARHGGDPRRVGWRGESRPDARGAAGRAQGPPPSIVAIGGALGRHRATAEDSEEKGRARAVAIWRPQLAIAAQGDHASARVPPHVRSLVRCAPSRRPRPFPPACSLPACSPPPSSPPRRSPPPVHARGRRGLA
jgi:hypothetical protein